MALRRLQAQPGLVGSFRAGDQNHAGAQFTSGKHMGLLGQFLAFVQRPLHAARVAPVAVRQRGVHLLRDGVPAVLFLPAAVAYADGGVDRIEGIAHLIDAAGGVLSRRRDGSVEIESRFRRQRQTRRSQQHAVALVEVRPAESVLAAQPGVFPGLLAGQQKRIDMGRGVPADLFLLAIALAYGEDALVKTLRQPGPSREPLDLLSNAAPADTLDVGKSHRLVLGREIQVDTAAIVALIEAEPFPVDGRLAALATHPAGAAYRAVALAVAQRDAAQRGDRMASAADELEDTFERGQPRLSGLLAAPALELLVEGFEQAVG